MGADEATLQGRGYSRGCWIFRKSRFTHRKTLLNNDYLNSVQKLTIDRAVPLIFYFVL